MFPQLIYRKSQSVLKEKHTTITRGVFNTHQVLHWALDSEIDPAVLGPLQNFGFFLTMTPRQRYF